MKSGFALLDALIASLVVAIIVAVLAGALIRTLNAEQSAQALEASARQVERIATATRLGVGPEAIESGMTGAWIVARDVVPGRVGDKDAAWTVWRIAPSNQPRMQTVVDVRFESVSQ